MKTIPFKKAGFSVVTPVIITSSDDYSEIILTQKSMANFGDHLIKTVNFKDHPIEVAENV